MGRPAAAGRGRRVGLCSLPVALLLSLVGTGAAEEPFSPYVDAAGNISLPTDFRESWVFLGAWAVAGEEGTEGFHLVYTEPGVVAAFRESGAFPDGAVLVKELIDTTSDDFTTGHVGYAGETTGWFVMVKDAEGRFPGNPLWGEGWGWALFETDDPSTTVTEDYEAECLPCHVPAEATDWIYLQGYPLLNR
jgi:hypothetical protein